MGVTGVNGFPCCSKKSVEVLETHEDFEDPEPQPEPVEDEIELLDDTLELEAEQDLESESESDLESELEPEAQLLPGSESELEDEVPVPVSVFVQTSNLAFNLAPRNASKGPRVDVQIQTAVGPKGTLELSISHEPRSSEPTPVKDGLHHTFRSVFVQTSKHLFRMDKVIQASDPTVHKLPLGIARHSSPVREWPFQKSLEKASKESLLSGNKLSKMFMEDVRGQTSHPSLGIEGFPPQTPIQSLLPENTSTEIQTITSQNFSAKFSEPLDIRMLDSRPTSASLPPALVSSTMTSRNSSSTELALDSKAPLSCKSSPGLRMESRSPMTQGSTTDLSLVAEQTVSPLPLLKPPEAGEPQKSINQEFALKPGYVSERVPMEGEVNHLQTPSLSPVPPGPWKEWSPAEGQEIHSDTEMVQARARTGRGGAKPQRRRDISSLFAPVDIPAEYEHPLTSRQVAAFQDVFQLFKPGSQGKLDMRSMKGALRAVGIQLSPQEVCEALRRADLDGDGAVDFDDFLGILTDNHRFAQCMGRMRNSRINDPHGLETLFFEMMSKFVGQGALAPNYYTDKQRVLRMSSWWKGLNHKHNRSYRSRSHTGLSFFCQATRLAGLNNRQLARSLHNLRDLNVQGPYSHVPNLPSRTRSTERRIRSRGPRLNNLARPCKPKPPQREPPRRIPEPLGQRPQSEEGTAELGPAPSPPTLVQSQLPSPPPATPQSHSLPNVYQ